MGSAGGEGCLGEVGLNPSKCFYFYFLNFPKGYLGVPKNFIKLFEPFC